MFSLLSFPYSLLSFPRKRESSAIIAYFYWIPAFAGMTGESVDDVSGKNCILKKLGHILKFLQNTYTRAVQNKTRKVLILAAGLLISLHAWAFNLYEAEMPVKDRTETVRNEAFSSLLEQVLIKISANPQIGTTVSVKDSLKNASHYVNQFSYTTLPGSKEPVLKVSFNPEQVNALLSQTGQPVFGASERPSVLIWTALEDNGTDQIIGSLSDSPLLTSLMQAAKQAGLPLVLPFADLDDLSAITFNNIWKAEQEPLMKASDRYQHQAVLAIKIKKDKGSPCLSRWTLFQGENPPFHWTEEAPECSTLLNKGMTKVMSRLTAASDRKTAEVQTVHLIIQNIQTVEEYQNLLDFLQHLPGVTDVQIEKAAPHEVSYAVQTNQTFSDLSAALENNSQLELIQKDILNNQLEYRLSP